MNQQKCVSLDESSIRMITYYAKKKGISFSAVIRTIVKNKFERSNWIYRKLES
ncbi:MAG: hypothetical protein ACNI3A_20110 [Desulfovibrio sp.]|uniref:hypothetical protein n=1 Tax=Desulfovibrio sp. 7SRBS1 TaxID=3378064 RepID=UPI003B3E6ABC